MHVTIFVLNLNGTVTSVLPDCLFQIHVCRESPGSFELKRQTQNAALALWTQIFGRLCFFHRRKRRRDDIQRIKIDQADSIVLNHELGVKLGKLALLAFLEGSHACLLTQMSRFCLFPVHHYSVVHFESSYTLNVQMKRVDQKSKQEQDSKRAQSLSTVIHALSHQICACTSLSTSLFATGSCSQHTQKHFTRSLPQFTQHLVF